MDAGCGIINVPTRAIRGMRFLNAVSCATTEYPDVVYSGPVLLECRTPLTLVGSKELDTETVRGLSDSGGLV